MTQGVPWWLTTCQETIFNNCWHLCISLTTLICQEADWRYWKCWKICPWLDIFRKDITPEEHNSIDEQMVSYRGTRSLRQYVKGKPHLWGLNIWGRCSSSGILCDFMVYKGGTGKKTKSFVMGGDVVVKLCESLPSLGTLSSNAWLVVSLKMRKVLPREAEDPLMPGEKRKVWSLSIGTTTNLLRWSHPTV